MKPSLQKSRRSSVKVINLGCARNLVDAQVILARLKAKGHRVVKNQDADTVIVNTCSFIETAREESIDTVLDLIELKKEGKIKKLVVAGCLPQRYGDQLLKELKGVDAFVGALAIEREDANPRLLLTPKHFAYLKICESCFNQCSFCAIPSIKGKFASRSLKSITEEVRWLDRQGVKEINIIGQDITAYGMDIYRKKSLVPLLKEIIAACRHIRWIRLLYTFPAHIDDALIGLIKDEEKICKYIDIPLQHISDKILQKMKRSITKAQTVGLIKKIRTAIPGCSVRTTFIVGFPGETDEDFCELLEFVKQTRFERAGVFKYSNEEGTGSYRFSDQVPEHIKEKRYAVLMEEQQKISGEILRKFLGRKLEVLVDERQKGEDNIYLARTSCDAPEVDGLVYVRCRHRLKAGDFIRVVITGTQEYDLAGEVA